MNPKSWPDLQLGNLFHLQEELQKRVRVEPFKERPKRVAGCDVSYGKNSRLAASVALFSFPDLELIEEAHSVQEITFPYIPTYLSFRELPALLKAFSRLKERPDLILVDGQGIAHPRGLGLASHLGVILDIPSIGCAKSRLVGEFDEPGQEKGAWTPLFYEGKRVGVVLRTRERTKPIFVSPGHRIDIPAALRLTLSMVKKFRVPEPIRYADRRSREVLHEKI